MKNTSAVYKIIHFPLTKIIVGLTVIGLVIFIVQMAAPPVLEFINVAESSWRRIISFVTCVFVLLAYYFLFKFYEKREVTELSSKGLGRSLVIGFMLGGLLQSLTIFVIYLRGGFEILSLNPVSFLVPAFVMSFTAAITEEVLVRGVIFRILEEKLGTYIALIISALIFGALHLGNPNSTPAAALGLALQAGTFLAAAYVISRNLWFPIAIHFAWNFTQGGIFGAAVSGNAVKKSLLTTKISGENWYTGGEFGPEGSIQATVFCLIAMVILLLLAHKQNKIIKPFWKTRSEELAAPLPASF